MSFFGFCYFLFNFDEYVAFWWWNCIWSNLSYAKLSWFNSMNPKCDWCKKFKTQTDKVLNANIDEMRQERDLFHFFFFFFFLKRASKMIIIVINRRMKWRENKKI